MAAGFSSLLAALALAAAAGSGGAGLQADDIPVAHTPKVPGGYGRTFPEPVLRQCTEPLAAGRTIPTRGGNSRVRPLRRP